MTDSRDKPDMGFNSAVIKPETRSNKAEDAEQPKVCNCVESLHLEGAVLCPDCQPEQPNQTREGNIEGKDLMIIEEIEGLMSQVNEKIHKLTFSHNTSDITKKQILWSQAIEEIDLFQKTTLFELRKAFE